jgi:hypothetical protein
MKQAIFALVLVSVLSSCDLGAEQEDVQNAASKVEAAIEKAWATNKGEKPATTQEKVVAPQPVKGPHISLKGVDITYNGAPLKMGETIEVWTAIIGEKPRPRFEGETLFYDNLGIYATLRTNNEKMVSTIQFVLNPKIDFIPGEDTTLKLFQGRLEIEGISISKETTVREINEALKKVGNGEMHCQTGRNACSTTIVINDQRLYVAASVDDKKYDGVIYVLSFEDVYPTAPEFLQQ